MKYLRQLLIALVSVVGIAAPSFAAVAHVQTVKVSDNDGGTTTTSTAATFSSGGLAICTVLNFKNGAVSTATATLDGGSSFTLDKTAADASSTVRVTIFSFPNVSAGSHTCNVTYGAAQDYATVFLTEVSGAATSSPLDGTGATGTGANGNASVGSYSATATSFWIAAMVVGSGNNPATVSAGSGWTIPTNGSETNGSANVVGGLEYQANPGGTSLTGNFTNDSFIWAAAGVAYHVLSAGGGNNQSLMSLGAN